MGQHGPGWAGRSLLQRDTCAKAGGTRRSADQGKGCAGQRGRGGAEVGCQRSMWLQYKGRGEEGSGRGVRKKKGPDSEGLVEPHLALAFHSTGRETH